MSVTPLREADLERPVQRLAVAEVEQALLGAILVNNKAYRAVAGFLAGEHFAYPVHGRIYAACGKLIERSDPATPVTLGLLFERDGGLVEVGGTQYLARLAESTVTVINAPHYGKIILDLYQRRELIQLAGELAADAQNLDRSTVTLASDFALSLGTVLRSAGSALGEWDAGDVDYTTIPPRGWILGNSFCRGFVSGLISEGSGGKTALRLAQCLGVATGRSFTGEKVFVRGRVLFLVLEDGKHEIMRRLRAAMLHHNISADELKGWLFIASPESFSAKLAMMVNGEIQTGALKADVEAAIAKHRIDLVVIDPLKKAHGVDENDNTAMDYVVSLLVEMAIKHNCAVDAPYHSTKGSPDPGNANRGRGGSAYKDGARLIYTLSPMSEKESAKLNIEDAERRLLRRLDSAKINLCPPGETTWFRLVSVPIGNTSETYPSGDHVQTVELWVPPDTWGAATFTQLNDILTEIDVGLPDGSLYSNMPRVGGRAAHVVVQKHLPDKSAEQAREIIATWIKKEVLFYVDYNDPTVRKPRKGLKVNPAKRPG